MNKIIVDVRTGRVRVVQLTPDEIRKRQEEAAAFQIEKNTRASRDNLGELREEAITALLETYEGDQLAPDAIKSYLRAKNG